LSAAVCWACGYEQVYFASRTDQLFHLNSHLAVCSEAYYMTMLIDIESEDTHRWTFASVGPWRFRWKPGLGIVFAFRDELSRYAQEAFPIGVHGSVATKDDAVQASKDWIKSKPTYDTPAWDPWWRKPQTSVQSITAPRRPRYNSAATLRESKVEQMAEYLRQKAEGIAAVFDIDTKEAELRLRIMVGDYHSQNFQEKIDAGFVELLSLAARPSGESELEERRVKFANDLSGASQTPEIVKGEPETLF
jgi:hypothetical protein